MSRGFKIFFLKGERMAAAATTGLRRALPASSTPRSAPLCQIHGFSPAQLEVTGPSRPETKPRRNVGPPGEVNPPR